MAPRPKMPAPGPLPHTPKPDYTTKNTFLGKVADTFRTVEEAAAHAGESMGLAVPGRVLKAGLERASEAMKKMTEKH